MVSPLRFLELLPGGARLRALRARLATLPTRRSRAFGRAIARLDDVIYDVIERRKRALPTLDHPADLVSLLLLARESDAEPLSDREIRDEVMTMFVAGHETTAAALTWCLYLLATHPQYQREVAREAEDVLGGREPGLDDLPKLTLARQAFEEAMRLYPPAWRLSRVAIDADRVAGYDVPAGSVVVVSPYLLHRDPALWPDPERFDPSRFAAEQSRARPRLAFIPFGAGQRMCLGAAFATAEAQIVLSILCRAVAFEPAPEHAVSFAPRLTLRPRGGMPLRVRPAAGAPRLARSAS
jgi:cytochrome P450